MRGVRGIAGHFLDAEVTIGDARDLREMRDRDDLRALAEAAQRLGDGVRRLTADAGVDLVKNERQLPATRRCNRKCDP